VLTARAENHVHGRDDLGDTIARLQSFQDAGADVLFAPGLTIADDIRHVAESVDRPVNGLARTGMPSVAELAVLGVARVSVGGAFAALGALGALCEAAEELRARGTYGYLERTATGVRAARGAFGRGP